MSRLESNVDIQRLTIKKDAANNAGCTKDIDTVNGHKAKEKVKSKIDCHLRNCSPINKSKAKDIWDKRK